MALDYALNFLSDNKFCVNHKFLSLNRYIPTYFYPKFIKSLTSLKMRKISIGNVNSSFLLSCGEHDSQNLIKNKGVPCLYVP